MLSYAEAYCATLFTAADISGRVASIKYIRDPMACLYGILLVVLSSISSALLALGFTSLTDVSAV